MKKEITLTQMKGKTVSGYTFSYDSEILIAFEEEAYIVFKAEEGYEGEVCINRGKMDIYDYHEDVLIDEGIFTKEEIIEMKKVHEEKVRLLSEERDRFNYERLKKKFEGE